MAIGDIESTNRLRNMNIVDQLFCVIKIASRGCEERDNKHSRMIVPTERKDRVGYTLSHQTDHSVEWTCDGHLTGPPRCHQI